MKKSTYIVLLTIFSLLITSFVNAENYKKLTEKECKKMLGEKTYERLNDLYMNPGAAMLQCQMRIESKKNKTNIKN